MKPAGPLTAVHRFLPRGPGHINVTPLIDIVMVLIIFYLLVGQLALDRRGEVDLPEATRGVEAEPTDTPITIAIRADGGMAIEAIETPPEVLARMLEVLLRQKPGRAVQIRADRATAYRHVRAALDACREAGVTHVELATRAETTTSGAGKGASP
ncbi:MAG: biopolymer transporter ExbD [Phycisphaeraceae bacterium]|nr:MAG: biopolymer transporter ExbD [Phycisphaeraceae bacterium]